MILCSELGELIHTLLRLLLRAASGLSSSGLLLLSSSAIPPDVLVHEYEYEYS